MYTGGGVQGTNQGCARFSFFFFFGGGADKILTHVTIQVIQLLNHEIVFSDTTLT